MDLNKLVKEHVNRYLAEAEERNPYVGIRDRSANYDVTNPRDLRSMFFDPQRKINKGAFVTIVYVEAAAVNKTFRNGGYTDADGNNVSAGDIEQRGRSLEKEYINSFFDSDDFKKKLNNKRGATRPFAVFTTVTQQLNFNTMNYDKRLNDIDDVFKNASDDDLNDFVANDSDFKKRIVLFKEQNPDMADEIDHYVETNSFPRDIIDAIRKTKLINNGKGWSSVDGNEFITKQANTGTEALRLTKSNNLRKEYQSYVILSDGSIKRISREEFRFLQDAFGGAKKQTDEKTVITNVRRAIEEINKRYAVRNYSIPSIAKMSFTIDGKPVTYSNHELQVGDITIDADDFLNAPLSENKRYSKLRKLVESKINEFDLDEILQEERKRRMVEKISESVMHKLYNNKF